MPSANTTALEPKDPRLDPALLKILRWLLADTSRILPAPDDADAISELARAIDYTQDHTRAMMAWSYGHRPGSSTRPLLKLEV